MSAIAKSIRNLYRKHIWSLAKVQRALADGLITEDEYNWIVG